MRSRRLMNCWATKTARPQCSAPMCSIVDRGCTESNRLPVTPMKGAGLIRFHIRLHVNTTQRRSAKKSLGLRSQSWQDTVGV